jgi:hypothetical protein
MCYTLRNQEDSIPFPLPPESPQMSHADAAIPKYQGFVIHVTEHAARIQHVEKPMAESYAAGMYRSSENDARVAGPTG